MQPSLETFIQAYFHPVFLVNSQVNKLSSSESGEEKENRGIGGRPGSRPGVGPGESVSVSVNKDPLETYAWGEPALTRQPVLVG